MSDLISAQRTTKENQQWQRKESDTRQRIGARRDDASSQLF
jgi:hypothetical protein